MSKLRYIILSLAGVCSLVITYVNDFTVQTYLFFLGLSIAFLFLCWFLRKRKAWSWGISISGVLTIAAISGWLSYMQSVVFALYVVIPLGYTGLVNLDFSCKEGPRLSPELATLSLEVPESGYLKVQNMPPERPALVVYYGFDSTLIGPLRHEVDHTLPQYVEGECGQRLVFEVFSVPLDSVALGLKNTQ